MADEQWRVAFGRGDEEKSTCSHESQVLIEFDPAHWRIIAASHYVVQPNAWHSVPHSFGTLPTWRSDSNTIFIVLPQRLSFVSSRVLFLTFKLPLFLFLYFAFSISLFLFRFLYLASSILLSLSLFLYLASSI